MSINYQYFVAACRRVTWLSVAAGVAAGVGSGLAAARWAGELNAADWPMLHKFAELLLAWPPVVGLLVIFVSHQFGTELKSLIRRIKKYTTAGGASVDLADVEQQVASNTPASMADVASSLMERGHAPPAEVPPPRAHTEPDQQAQGPVDRNITESVRTWWGEAADVDDLVEWIHLNPGPTVEAYTEIHFRFNAERTFNVIFGTQVALLDEYASTPDTPHPLADAIPFYTRHQHLIKTSGAESGPTLQEFMEYLETQSLVRNVGPADGPLHQITLRGQRFIGYIKQYYPARWNTRIL